MSLSSPVAVFIFNRPDHFARVFAAIARVRPRELLVIADGPRFAAEEQQCQDARALLEKVDWDCRVLTNFSDVNLGCRVRMAGGISWVFSQVEEAIILEDDCVPDPTFFLFCEELLAHYRSDHQVMHISGTNYLPQPHLPESFLFSRVVPCSGWATWRRAWKYFDTEMIAWPNYRNTDDLLYFKSQASSLLETFDSHYFGWTRESWDGNWVFACTSRRGLSIIPKTNLVENVGFGPGATHTVIQGDYVNPPIVPMAFPLVYPSTQIPARDFDIQYLRTYNTHGLLPQFYHVKRKILKWMFV